jgi:hypothetical protein
MKVFWGVEISSSILNFSTGCCSVVNFMLPLPNPPRETARGTHFIGG